MRKITSPIKSCYLLGCLVLMSFASYSAVANANTQSAEVEVIKAEADTSLATLTLIGTVEATQNAQLAQLESGVVAELSVEVGDIVKQGDKLLVLDTELAKHGVAQQQASVAAAKAALTEADRLLAEIITLSKQQLVAETLMAERQADVEIAKAELSREKALLAQEKETLDRHTLYAPFSGVIAKRYVNLGEWVTQQTPVFNLVKQDDLRLNVAIPQEYLLALSSSDVVAVRVTPDFTQAESIDATLNRIVAVADSSNRTVTGLVYLPDNKNFMAGMSAMAEISVPASEQETVWLPKSAIKQHPDGGQSVFSVVAGKTQRHLIQTVNQQGDWVAVTGVPNQASVVVSGVALLKDNESVRTKPSDKPSNKSLSRGNQ